MAQVDVSISGISVAYGDTTPLRNLSLDVHKGEFLSLLGPSGCGKTTTLRAVAGFVQPFEGDIRLGERSILGVPPNHRNIGMVYQDYALFPHMTVERNVAFGMKMRGLPAEDVAQRVTEVIRKLQLEGLAQRYPSQLSGGQQQRVALARALVINPAVLLLDEPLAALDKQLRADMQFELRHLQREVGITAMFVTHDQEEALSLSDRVAVMNKGKILQVDTPRAVYDHPAHRFVAEFIGVANFLKGAVLDSHGDSSAVQLEGLPGTHRLNGRRAPGPVEVLIRPENLRLARKSDAVPAGANSIAGRVINSVFVGNALKYQVAVSAGRPMRVDVAVGSAPEFHGGEDVTLLWRPQDARLFRGEVAEP